MVFCRPAAQFCCGCSVLHGIKFVLLLHFVINGLCILEAVGLIFFPEGSWSGSSSLGVEAVVAGFCLAGLPIIVAAMWGVASKTEVVLRVYLFYLFLTFLFDSYFVLKIFFFSGGCSDLPHLLQAMGEAFACGMVRLADGSAIFMAWAIQIYFIYVVWSYVEDMAAGGGPDLSDLLVDEDTFMLKQRKEDPFASIVGFGEHVPAEYGSVYDAAVDGGLGGSTRIFNGHRHEMAYPPPKGLRKVC